MTNTENATAKTKNIVMESVSLIFWDLAKNKYRYASITIIALSLLSIFFVFTYPPSSVIFFLIFIIIAYSLFLYYKAQGEFMLRFALANNFTYEPTANLTSVTGRLFELGGSKKISHVVRGHYGTWPIRIFYYQYSKGSGKHKKTDFFTVLEVSFTNDITFPFILLQSHTMSAYYTSRWGKSGDTTITLEPEHKNHFILHTTKEYEIEALQIFTPETLQAMRENAGNVSVEFSKNKIYLYDDKLISNQKELIALQDAAQKLLDSSGAFITRLRDDFAVLHPYHAK